ncbi:hypothetical protein F3Y22_tig00110391pilonHSYRG00138 [Hibiscus syriacus]|uniref:Uncharacterized protein n=1 Tax=Hibiscus syriacus TaxID=106335 RepID=A0A6A3AQW0_HIBSY|nr:hypothetical protein F3Y22_tig00110391pilonHSYRG00138 [Hibiscus syriacus]
MYLAGEFTQVNPVVKKFWKVDAYAGSYHFYCYCREKRLFSIKMEVQVNPLAAENMVNVFVSAATERDSGSEDQAWKILDPFMIILMRISTNLSRKLFM